MNRYTVAGGIAAGGFVVFAALVVQADNIGVAVRGDPIELNAAQKLQAKTAVQSVFPNAPMAGVREWSCVRGYRKAATAKQWWCRGVYEREITAEQYLVRVKAGQKLNVVSRDGSTVTVQRTTRKVKLNAAQKQAHAPMAGWTGTTAGNVLSIRIMRDEADSAKVYFTYSKLDEVSSSEEVADLEIAGKLLWILDSE